MDVFKTLKPNEPGTKKLVRQYGDRLVAVRYRKSVNPPNIYTTVEVIVDKKPYIPGISHSPAESDKDSAMVPLRMTYYEKELRQIVKTAGARWHPEEKRWYLSYKKVCELKLKDRILKSINV